MKKFGGTGQAGLGPGQAVLVSAKKGGRTMRQVIIAVSLALACTIVYADEDMDRRIDALQKELDALKSQVENSKVQGRESERTASESKESESKESESSTVETSTVETSKVNSGEGESSEGEARKEAKRESFVMANPSNEQYLGPAERAKEQEAYRNTTLGGYGEINYNNYKDGSVKDEFDLQRFVLFFGYKFNDRTRLFSEIEYEHALTGDGVAAQGEVAMEQAFIEYDLTQTGTAALRSGLMLMPIGIVNEYHESPTYYGVERNEVETRIIPTTWRELGVAFRGNIANGLEYNSGISTTPDASLFTNASAGFRNMLSKGSKVAANDLGFFAGLNYRGIPGVLLGGGVFTGNTAQNGQGKGANAAALQGVDANLTIWDLRARYSGHGWNLRAVYSQGTLGDTAAINAAAGLPAGSNKAAPESFSGWYAEAAYHLYRRGAIDIVPFVRYADYDTQESVAPGFTIDPTNDENVVTVGLSLYVDPQVVFKFDLQDYSNDDTKDRFNVGVGWMF